MQRDLWFEDFTVGQSFETAGCTLSEAQILEFGWAHDPQPFHIDVEAARVGPFGGLIASGAVTIRETVHDGLASTPEAFLGLFSGDNIGKMLVRL